MPLLSVMLHASMPRRPFCLCAILKKQGYGTKYPLHLREVAMHLHMSTMHGRVPAVRMSDFPNPDIIQRM